MKKTILFLFAAALLASGGYFIYGKRAGFGAVKPAAIQCAVDTDCKLIYSNCGCAAVPVSDQRDSLADAAVCKWNLCRGTGATAACGAGKCVKSVPKR